MDDIKTGLEILGMIIGAIIWTFAVLWKAHKYVEKEIQNSEAAIKKSFKDKAEAEEKLRLTRAVTYEQSFQTHKVEVERFITKMMDFEDTVEEFEKKVALQINDLENQIKYGLGKKGGK